MKKTSIFYLVMFVSCTVELPAQVWSNTGLTFPGTVWAMENYNSTLQVAGAFSTPNEINALRVYNGNLYSGGSTNGNSTNVYKNGISIGSTAGGNNFISAMTIFNGQLYVAGSFTSINGVAALNIAKWNGAVWDSVGPGVGIAGDYMNTLCVYNNNLYTGGAKGKCYQWDGTNWNIVGTFLIGLASGYIRSMCVFNNALYVGGTFDFPNQSLAVYDGANWLFGGTFGDATMGDGVSAIAEYNGQLYCGGNFKTVDSDPANNIVRGNGINWWPMGTGTNGPVASLFVFNQSLYVGGAFSSADTVVVSNIAKWAPACIPPPATISYTGSSLLCLPGSSLLLSANTGTGYTYQWKFANSDIAGATSSTYLVTQGGVYSVVVSNSATCSTTSSNVLVSSSYFTVSIASTGPLNICSGSSVILNAVAPPIQSFQWKKNGVAIAGATTNTYAVTTAGTYTVDGINGPCTQTSPPVIVSTGPLTPTIAPPGTSTVCSGSSITFAASTGAGYTYRWYRNNVLLSATGSTFTTATKGSYKVEVSLSGSCAVLSNTVKLSVINNSTPTLTASGPTTFCAGQSVTLTANTFTGVAYQWQKNNVNISGATNQSYTATSTGIYRANETANGCSKFTPKKSVKVNCRLGNETTDEMSLDEIKEITDMKLFPNPFTDELNILITSSANEITDIKILDVLGKTLRQQSIITNQQQKVNALLPPGIYIVTAIVDGQPLMIKVVKTKY